MARCERLGCNIEFQWVPMPIIFLDGGGVFLASFHPAPLLSKGSTSPDTEMSSTEILLSALELMGYRDRTL